MKKIYVVESSCSLGVFHRTAFTNKKKAIAYKKYYDLKNKIEQLGETNTIYEMSICQIDYKEDFEELKMEQLQDKN